MEYITEIYNSLSMTQLVLIGTLVLLVWFLPAILAVFFNPRHAKLIFFACIPAGFSFIAYGGVMLWAVTGKVFEKFQSKVDKAELKTQSNES